MEFEGRHAPCHCSLSTTETVGSSLSARPRRGSADGGENSMTFEDLGLIVMPLLALLIYRLLLPLPDRAAPPHRRKRPPVPATRATGPRRRRRQDTTR